MAQAAAKQMQNRLFAILTIDGRRFFLPQDEIHTLESIFDIDKAGPLPDAVGWFHQAGEKWPVYCLDREFKVLSHIPANRQASVLLSNNGFNFGILCDRIASLEDRHHIAHSIPDCMLTPRFPFDCFIILDGKVECVTTTALLARVVAGGVR